MHYDIRTPGIRDQDIVDLKLHRGAANSNGPVIELLGRQRKGGVLINNAYLDDLLDGRLYLVVYTRDKPRGAVHARLYKR